MNPEQITIAIPTKNRPDSLSILLESIDKALKKSDCRVLEILILDDKSHPENQKIYEKILKNYSKLPVFLHKNQRLPGPSGTRNQAALLAKGEWLLFLDDDLLICETYFEAIKSQETTDHLVGIEGITKISQTLDPFRRTASTKTFFGGFGSGNILWRKETFFRCGGFDENYFEPRFCIHFREDTDLGLRMQKYGRVILHPHLEAFHPSDPKRNWAQLLQDTKKYYFESYFLKQNPGAKSWIGGAIFAGKLGTRQTRAQISILLCFCLIPAFFNPETCILVAVSCFYLSLHLLLFRNYKTIAAFFLLLPTTLFYPFFHTFWLFYGKFKTRKLQPVFLHHTVKNFSSQIKPKNLQESKPECFQTEDAHKDPENHLQNMPIGKWFVRLLSKPPHPEVFFAHKRADYAGKKQHVKPSALQHNVNLSQKRTHLKILCVTRVFYPQTGGIQNHVLSLCKRLSGYGHEIDILTLNESLDHSLSFETEKWLHFQDSEPVFDDSYSLSHNPLRVYRLSFSGNARFFLPDFCKLNQFDFHAYDLIHIHAVDSFLDILSLKSRLEPAFPPIFLTTHGGFFHTDFAKTLKLLWFFTITAFSLQKVKRVIACSHSDFLRFSQVSKRLEIIENGVEIEDLFCKRELINPKKWLYVGGFQKNKNTLNLLLVFERLYLQDPEFSLVMVGDGDDLAKAKEFCSQKNLPVQFLHNLSRKELVSQYLGCSIFVSASSYEGFGMSVVEAMAAGMILFLNQIDPFFCFVPEEKNGALSKFSTPETCANDFLKKILSCPNLLEKSRESLKLSQKFEWERAAGEIENLFLRTIF